jgi:hypothetical protein
MKMGSILREMGGDPTREQKEFEVECDGCAAPVMVKVEKMADVITARERGRIDGVHCEKCKK